jgi:MoaA/NifB/PqqE/SkfB family radical SAM enzyme
MIRAATRIFEATVVYTNGTVTYPGIDAVWMVSIDGTREVHDKIRGKGVHDKVIKNIENGIYKNPIVHITITRQNQHNLEDFLEEMNGIDPPARTSTTWRTSWRK